MPIGNANGLHPLLVHEEAVKQRITAYRTDVQTQFRACCYEEGCACTPGN